MRNAPASTLKVAFASAGRQRVDQHFGAAESFLVYEVSPEQATLTGVGEFRPESMDGNEDKLAARVAFLTGCSAVFVLAVGASAIQQLLAQGIQPVRVDGERDIDTLLADLGNAIRDGGVPWIDRALAARRKADNADRFRQMEAEGWDG